MCIDGRYDGPVALKRSKLYDDGEGVAVAVLRETVALRSLRHPNVVQLYDVLEKGLELVLESGEHDLSMAIKRRRVPNIDMVALHIIRGIEYCHSMKIMHRDLKPQNIVLFRDVAKLVDFGQMRCFQTDGRTYTRVSGTMWYRAPEDILSDGAYNEKVDVWAFACIFAEMIDGTPLFPGAHEVNMLFRIFARKGREAFDDFVSFPHYYPDLIPSFHPVMHPHSDIDLLLVTNPHKRPTAEQARQLLENRVGRDPGWLTTKRAWARKHMLRHNTVDRGIGVAQNDLLNENHHFILVEWLLTVHESLALQIETIMLAISILDKYTHRVVCKRAELQMVGVMALSIACKFQEERQPTMRDYEDLCVKLYTKDQFIEMEMSIWEALNHKVDTSLLRLPTTIFRRAGKKARKFALVAMYGMLLTPGLLHRNRKTVALVCVSYAQHLLTPQKGELTRDHVRITQSLKRLVEMPIKLVALQDVCIL